MIDLRELSWTAEGGKLTRGFSGELVYNATIPPSAKRYAFIFEGDIPADEYFTLEYSAMGFGRPKIYRQPCVYGEGERGGRCALWSYAQSALRRGIRRFAA